MLAFFPVAFVPIEELAPITLVFDNRVALTAVFIPVVVLLSVSVPFLSSVYDYGVSFSFAYAGRTVYQI